MRMHNDWLEDELQRSLSRKEIDRLKDQPPPSFATVMQAAELRHAAGRKRLRFATLAAVLAMVAILTIGRWSPDAEPIDDEFLIAATIFENTSWSAPSDVLLPQHRFDIYGELPALFESTEFAEGTLL